MLAGVAVDPIIGRAARARGGACAGAGSGGAFVGQTLEPVRGREEQILHLEARLRLGGRDWGGDVWRAVWGGAVWGGGGGVRSGSSRIVIAQSGAASTSPCETIMRSMRPASGARIAIWRPSALRKTASKSPGLHKRRRLSHEPLDAQRIERRVARGEEPLMRGAGHRQASWEQGRSGCMRA